jgi:hypothetical protein
MHRKWPKCEILRRSEVAQCGLRAAQGTPAAQDQLRADLLDRRWLALRTDPRATQGVVDKLAGLLSKQYQWNPVLPDDHVLGRQLAD